MLKLFYIQLLSLFFISASYSQIIFEEHFESASAPIGWTIETNASDGGWQFTTPGSVSSNAFSVPSNGSLRVVGTNDDTCNCNKSNDFLISPIIDLSSQTSAVLKFDAFYLDNLYQGNQENATIEISTDGGNTWSVIEDLHGHGSWDTHIIDLGDYVGQDNIKIGFRYNDGSGWLYGCAIDNVILEVPPMLEASMVSLSSKIYGEVGTELPIKGFISNNGINTITSLEISYSIDGGIPIVETIDNLEIESFSFYNFTLANTWIPTQTGVFNIEATILQVNGSVDEDTSNNTTAFSPEVFNVVNVPNKIVDLISFAPIKTEVAGISNMLNKPTDLDFFPLLGKDELWVINQRNETSGGSTVTVSNTTSDAPGYALKVDENAWHFMSLPTGISFSSDNFNFATSPGVKDANHNGGTFTGPTLWSSNPDIYAQDSGGNGSHLDMLHGSPYSMGITHEVDNVFWVYDNWNKDIVRYDFVADHGPGNADHDDGRVRRFKNIGINASGDIPNHLILDKPSGWLYFVDNGNSRVIRLNINSGNLSSIPLVNEVLTEHSSVSNFEYEVIIDQGLMKPCGIEIFDNKLLVGDYENGDIIVYDINNNNFEEIGRISTNAEGLTGIKIGPDGNIWCLNRLQNKLYVVSPSQSVSTQNINQKIDLVVSPNPSTGFFNILLPSQVNIDKSYLSVKTMDGKIIYSDAVSSYSQNLDLSNLVNGMYILELKGSEFYGVEKIILQR